ncbi:MAG TPA: site-2 protease family protein [Anaerohalosphaeraceae bacterium]|nr:site-2 protease family protein [Anaerohalosphaeraceae bacterium]
MVEKILFFVPGFLVGFTVHEAAHALVSKWLGDRYAESQGRISLNPLRHLSPMGTLMMFIAGFGWGKPVPVNLYNYKHPKLYYLLSSLAGPASNILLCVLALAGLYGLAWFGKLEIEISDHTRRYIIYYGWLVLTSILYINAILAVFNLIPIPPLDGSKIWPCLIPGMRPVWTGKVTWLWIILLVVMMKGDVTSKMIISPAIQYISNLMPISYVEDELDYDIEKLPEGFPPEMKSPEGAAHIFYESDDDTTDPNLFYTYFFMEEPYPATQFRRQVAEKLSGLGWSETKHTNVDHNTWQLGEIVHGEQEEYRELSWFQTWEKEQYRFQLVLSYFTDPNGCNPTDSWFSVDYIYAINDPNNI